MNTKRLLPLVLTLLVLALVGCDLLPLPFAPEPSPTALPVGPSATKRPTSTPQVLPPTFTPLPPTATRPSPTSTAVIPTRTFSPTAPPASLSFIQITQPGSGSKIISPVKVSGESNSTFEQNLVVAVYDSVGKLLASKPTTIKAELGRRGPFSVELAFAVTREQAGRVVVYETSPAYGGILHLASTEVTLRPAGGKAEILNEKPALPLIQVYSPPMNASLSGGVMTINGLAGPIFENQFSAVLCAAIGTGKPDPICGTAGNILARAVVTINAPDAGKSGLYSAELAYKITQKTRAWLVVYDNSARDGQPVFVTSQVVTLLP